MARGEREVGIRRQQSQFVAYRLIHFEELFRGTIDGASVSMTERGLI